VTSSPQRWAGRFLLWSRLAWLPLRVRRGFLAGCWWSFYPWTSYWRGTHEPAIQQRLAGLGAMQGWSCWDLGAHFGFYSVGLARRVGPTGEVAAFEPNPLSFRRLEYHRRLNRLAWLKVYSAAASDQSGQTELYTYGELHSTTTHLRYEGETRVAACAPLVVKSIRLDDLVAAGILRPPDFVKIDVEGHGHRALAGMHATVARHRPHLLCALHSPNELTGMQAILAPLGYDWPATAEVGQDVLIRRPA